MTSKRIGFGLFIFFQTLVAQAQDIGAELQWYQNFPKENLKLAPEKALDAANEKLKEAIEIRDQASEASARKEIGLIHLLRTRDYEKAMDFFIQSLALEDALSNNAGKVITLTAIADVFKAAGDNHNSAESLEQAILVSEPFKNVNVLVFLLNKLGKINATIGKMDEALENYEHVLNYKDQLADPGPEAEALFNIAHLYTIETQYTEALKDHKQALAVWRSAGNKKSEAQSLNDIGELYRLMKNDEKALANHVVALEIRQAIQDQAGVAESYNNIGALYFQQNNFTRAIDNLMLALKAARDSEAQEQELKSYDYLSQCYKALRDYQKSLEYRDLFVALDEFIQRDKNQQQLAETQNRYEISKKQSQIERLESIRAQREKELQEQMQFRNFLIVIAALVLLVAALIFYLYIATRRAGKKLELANKKVQEQNQALQDLNATKDKFFSIISHDLKGPLNSFTSFSGLLINHTDSLSKDEIKMLAKDLDKSLKNLFALLENLLEWSRSQTGNIEFKPEVFDLGVILTQNQELLNAQAQNKNIRIENLNTKPVYASAHKHSVNTVVRNLISNAIKFTPPAGTISLDVQQTSQEIKVSVRDTGVGMSPEVMQKLFRLDTKHTTKGTADEKGTGLGLILCKEFIEKNGGKIWVESREGEGSVFYFTLLPSPVPASQAVSV